MKRIFLMSVMVMLAVTVFGHKHVAADAQVVSDTLYYADNNLKCENRSEASFYRVLKQEGKGLVKRDVFQDFYLNGTLKAEGGYSFIDLTNDNNTVLDGDVTTYYPNGTEKWRGSYKDGKRQGYFTLKMRDGSIATVLFANGESRLDHFVITKPDGNTKKHPIAEIKNLL